MYLMVFQAQHERTEVMKAVCKKMCVDMTAIWTVSDDVDRPW